MPVFAVWADWNDGTDEWDNWKNNPLNQVLGAYQTSPRDLCVPGSFVQETWLGWLGQLVARLSKHDNVAAWEIFSELDGIGRWGNPPAEANALVFVQAAAGVIKGADPRQRPVTASTAWWNTYPNLYANAAIDIVQFHRYANDTSPPGDGDLDVLLQQIIASLPSSGKPVLIGEGGLDYNAPNGGTATTLPYHETATRHAVWAALVSGAMNGRALWWEDGYDIQQNPDAGGPEFVYGYPPVEKPAVTFLGDQDVSGFAPVPNAYNSAIVGGAIGDAQTVLAWFRFSGCSRTGGWSCSGSVSGVTEYLTVPGAAPSWQATFYDPATGAALPAAPATITRAGATLAVPLPAFSDDVAVKLVASSP